METSDAPGSALRLALFSLAFLFFVPAGSSQSSADEEEPIKVDLVTLEDCQRADLLAKRKFIFHLYDCFAEVQLGEMGEVLSFEPLDGKYDICRKVIEECRRQ
jgi:hypothetical protein